MSKYISAIGKRGQATFSVIRKTVSTRGQFMPKGKRGQATFSVIKKTVSTRGQFIQKK